jgi:type I restriction enzyme M protein
MTLIDTGIEKGLIRFDEDQNFITYIYQNKKRNYKNPEEKVQAETFLTLILIYGYPENRIKQFVPVQIGVDTTKQADIVVYDDDDCVQPYIVVECKKDEKLTEQEFQQAVNQAESYAITLSATFMWITSGLTNEFYQIPKNRPKTKRTITDIPNFGDDNISKYKYVKGGFDPRNPNQKYFDLEPVNEKELVKKFKTIHDALYSEGYTPESALDEVNKLIFCKLFDEKKPVKVGTPYLFQIYETEGEGEAAEQKALDDLEERIQQLYKQGREFTEVLIFGYSAIKFLTEHGYLAVVIPDGILTNSSLQYVRDNLKKCIVLLPLFLCHKRHLVPQVQV